MNSAVDEVKRLFETFILPLWGIIDQIYYQCNRLHLVDPPNGNVFRVRLTRYKGGPLEMSDGTFVQSGDPMLKIHLYNYQLMKQMIHMDSDIRRALYVYEAVEKSLPGLAFYIRSHPNMEQIKGIIGITLLNRGIKRLGFDSFDINNKMYRSWKKSYMILLHGLCHGGSASIQSGKHEPKFVVMSKEKLLNRYPLF